MSYEVYDDISDELLQRISHTVKKFINRGLCPLGTEQPFWYYKKSIPDKDFACIHFPEPSSPIPILFLAVAGYYKTVLMKRLAYYFFKNDYRILVIEPKEAEWYKIQYQGSKFGLAFGEKPDSIPVVSYLPSYVLDQLPQEQISKFKITTADVKDFNSLISWLTLLPEGAAIALYKLAKEYDSADEIMNYLEYAAKGEIHGSSRTSIISRFGMLMDENFFDKRYKPIGASVFDKYWLRTNKAITTSLFAEDEKFAALYTGHLLGEVKKWTLEHPDMLKKLLIIDDTPIVADQSRKSSETSYSVKQIVRSLILWRSMGFQMCFASQDPNAINKRILDNCKWFVVGKIGDVDSLKKYFGEPSIIDTIKNLHYEPDRRIAQYCLVYPNKLKCRTFYPLMCPVGHF